MAATRVRTSHVIATQAAVVVALGVLLFVGNNFNAFLPTPAALVASGSLLATHDLYWHLGVTLYEAVAGLGIAMLLGVSLGVGVGANRTATEFFTPIILALYSVPKIVFLPVLLIVFGTGLPPKIANAALHAIFPVVLNSLVGMREVNRIHLKAARSMLASRGQMIAKVLLPSMVLPVFAGVRLGLGLSIMGSLLAELFESKAGIGYLINQFYTKGLIGEMLVLILLLVIIILMINAGMKSIELRLSHWRST